MVCVTKEGLELEETDDEKKVCEAEATQFEDLCKTVKEALGNKVEKVVMSNCTTDSPLEIRRRGSSPALDQGRGVITPQVELRSKIG